MARPATIADKYVLIRPLATGGMSEVFLARQTGLEGFEKLVVLKRILPHLAAEERFVNMFLDEARTAADLRHTNIVNIFEVGEDQGSWFIAMEYLHGRTVRQIRKLHPAPLPIPLALQIVLDSATGLAYAHQKVSLQGQPLRIVHRDVKPGNLMVTFEGITKILDFGIAKARVRSRQTEAGRVTGTAAYMSPEQAVAGKIDERSDQFSLGVVLYELVTGTRLFARETDMATMQSVVRCDVPPASSVVDGIPAALDEIIARALQRSPLDRFDSCSDLASALLDFLDDARTPHGNLHVSRFLNELVPDATDSFAGRPLSPAEDATRTRTNPAAAGAGPAWVVPEDQRVADTVPVPPPSVPTEDRLTNLAPDPALFVGRVRDLDALTQLANEDGARIITLLGPGGAGKSRLATRFGQLALRDRTFESVWFCDLSEARTLADVLTVVSRALDVPLTASVDDESAVDLLGRAIDGRGRALVILDNFERIIDVAPASVGVWSKTTEKATFLVTSRELLRLPGEVPREVGPLSLPDPDKPPMQSEAVQLFVDRARSVRSGYELTETDAPAVTEIVTLLDGLPLAIELAASRMGVFEPQQLLERLPERFKVLTGTRRDATDRQATLRATIDWSWSALEPWEQTALAQTSVFRGGFGLAAAEYVLDLSAHPEAPWVADVVQALCDKSLVRRFSSGGTLRFGMYESIRAYALERANEASLRERAAARHSAYYLQTCVDLAEKVYTHGGQTRLSALFLERDNLLAALELARDTGNGTHALQAVLALDPVYSTAGPLRTHLEHLTTAIGVAQQDPNTPEAIRARALEARGRAHRTAGLTDNARQDFEEALDAARGCGERLLEGHVLRYLGTLRQLRGDVERAAEYYERALEIHELLGDRRFEGLSLGSLAVLSMELGRLEEAARQFEEAVEILREVGDVTSEGIYHGNLGAVHQLQGETEAARTHYEQALEVHRRVGNRRFEGMVLGYLGSLAHDQGSLDEARDHYGSALRILREVGDRRFEAMFLGYVGVVLQEQGQLEEAGAHYDRALDILRAVGDRRLEGLFLGFRGGLLATLDSHDDAEDALARAEELVRAVGDPLLLHTVLINRGHLDLAESRRSAAHGDLDAAQGAQSRADDRVATAKSRPEEGQAAPAEMSDDVRFALRILTKALDDAI